MLIIIHLDELTELFESKFYEKVDNIFIFLKTG